MRVCNDGDEMQAVEIYNKILFIAIKTWNLWIKEGRKEEATRRDVTWGRVSYRESTAM